MLIANRKLYLYILTCAYVLMYKMANKLFDFDKEGNVVSGWL